MNIWILTQYFPPEVGAPQARLSEMARVWNEAGHSVTVLTGFPNHPTGIIPPEYRGKVFLHESRNGLVIWRHWLFATPNRGFVKKILCHLSFMISSVLLSLFRGERPDVMVVSSPTFFSVISAYVFSRVRRFPYVFEVRDLWPGIFIELGVLKNRFLIAMLEAVERFLYRGAYRVIPVTEGFKENIAARGIQRGKIHVITNGADLMRFSPGEKNAALLEELGVPRDKRVVLYAGAHGISHALQAVLEAAERIQSRMESVHFLFVGEGAEKQKLVGIKTERKLENVTFASGVERDCMTDLYRSADICLVPLRNIEGFKTFIPSKMFEMMACARPIIASVRGEAARILESSGCAEVVPPEDADALAESVIRLLETPGKSQAMGQKGLQYVREHYDRKKLAERYLEILQEMKS